MKTILLSIAHACDCSDKDSLLKTGRHPQGAVNDGYSEYRFSIDISRKLYQSLSALKVPCKIFDASEGLTHLTYGRIYQEKILWVNKQARWIGQKECLAVEIHHNSVLASGYACLYFAGSVEGKRAAIHICERFSKDRWTHPHWIDPENPDNPGVIERPGEYGGSVGFLEKTICPAIIVEAEGMQFPRFIAENWETEAELIREALCRYAGGHNG